MYNLRSQTFVRFPWKHISISGYAFQGFTKHLFCYFVDKCVDNYTSFTNKDTLWFKNLREIEKSSQMWDTYL